jgi:catecholate siderophore receptor
MPGRKKSAGGAMFWGTRGWIAAGTLAAYAVIGGPRSSLAEKEKSDPAGSTAAEATLPLKKFDIAPGPLHGTVEAYEKATGLTVKIVLPAGTLAGFNSQGVVGLYREDEALQLLLQGTGLNYRMVNATTMVVGVQAKDTVSVTDSVTNSVSLTKVTEPLLTTAQSVKENLQLPEGHPVTVKLGEMVLAALARSPLEAPGNATGVQLTGVYHNLLRRWAEM